MTAIEISAVERHSGKLTNIHWEEAVRAVRDDGYVILNEAVELEHVEILCQKMLEDVDFILNRDDAPFNFNRGNIQQDPPPFPPFLFRDVMVNDLVISITKAILGKGLKNGMYSGNTALPGSTERQPVHADSGQLWPDLDVATPPYALVVNVLPMDVSPANGSTEIWPGTHKDTSVTIQEGEIKVPESKLAEWQSVSPGFQYSAPAGSVVIRDMRLWHAGMPNPSSTPRPMIALIHYVTWWTGLTPLVFAKGSEGYLEHPDLHTVAQFVDGEIDYLNRNQSFDFKK